jgi:hypothetical protein
MPPPAKGKKGVNPFTAKKKGVNPFAKVIPPGQGDPKEKVSQVIWSDKSKPPKEKK